jgi:hypothetical protein
VQPALAFPLTLRDPGQGKDLAAGRRHRLADADIGPGLLRPILGQIDLPLVEQASVPPGAIRGNRDALDPGGRARCITALTAPALGRCRTTSRILRFRFLSGVDVSPSTRNCFGSGNLKDDPSRFFLRFG